MLCSRTFYITHYRNRHIVRLQLMNAKDSKQIGLGLLTTFLVFLAGDFIPSVFPFSSIELPVVGEFLYWQAVEGAILMSVAACAGAYVARLNFIGPAVLFSICIWAIGVHILYAVASSAGQGDFSSIVVRQSPNLLLTMIVAALGAYFGSGFAKEIGENDVTAA